jgi:Zn-dependent protease
MNEPTPGAGEHSDVARPLEITTFYTPPTAPRPKPVRFVRPAPPRSSLIGSHPIAITFFLATCVSVFAPSNGVFAAVERLREAAQKDQLAVVVPGMLTDGAIYFGAVMAILIAHEMGHFLQAKWYKVPATPPFFIPFPISPFGTMGAVIIQGAGVANRKSLFDIAISGPLAGLVLTIPITIIGLHHVGIEPYNPTELSYNAPLILQWLSNWIKGPIPAGYVVRSDDPWLFAGWVGIFITALNLMPIGQLDGGHILYTLIGRGAHRVAILLLALAVAYMIFHKQISYGLMVVLLFLSGPRHPPTTDDQMPLGVGRIVLGWLTLAFVIVGFTPSPFILPEVEPHEQQRHQQPAASRLYDVRLDRPERAATDQLAQRDFMNRSASRESCSSLVNMRRQIFVAAAKSGRARPNASTTIQPSYFVSLRVLNVVSQSTCPSPGVPRSFSEMWTCAV